LFLYVLNAGNVLVTGNVNVLDVTWLRLSRTSTTIKFELDVSVVSVVPVHVPVPVRRPLDDTATHVCADTFVYVIEAAPEVAVNCRLMAAPFVTCASNSAVTHTGAASKARILDREKDPKAVGIRCPEKRRLVFYPRLSYALSE
jgi:hypothetical protein